MGRATDQWAAGSTYEDFMGRWSRQIASKFVSWLRVPAGVHWLDVGCGTGALTDAICSAADPGSVMGCDPSEPFIEYARAHCSDARCSFAIGGAGALPTRPGGFGSVTSSLALNFFPEPDAAAKEMREITGPGGVVSACVWDYASGMGFLRHFWNVASTMDPTARELDEGERFPICRPEALEALFRNTGLGDIRCDPIEISTKFASFDDYWRPFLGGTGPAPTYVAGLSESDRTALAGQLNRTLTKQTDGTIALTARAWAVCGRAHSATLSA